MKVAQNEITEERNDTVKKNLKPANSKIQKITFTEEVKDRIGCQELDPEYLEAPGICRFRNRIGPDGFLQGCTREDCRFTHRLPKHIKFLTRDTSKVSHSEYNRYNLRYIQALEDLERDCEQCKKKFAAIPDRHFSLEPRLSLPMY